MKTIQQSSLLAELQDLLKLMGRLNTISLELQFQEHNLIEYRHTLNKCIEIAANDCVKTEDSLYTRDYGKLAEPRNLSNTLTLYTVWDLKTLTSHLKERLSIIRLAYNTDFHLLQYFISKLCSLTLSNQD
jgi:hypothetical protein